MGNFFELSHIKKRSAGSHCSGDDRSVTAGVMFSDADLLGIPIRIVISPRNLKEKIIEVTARDKSFTRKVPLDSACDSVLQIISELS